MKQYVKSSMQKNSNLSFFSFFFLCSQYHSKSKKVVLSKHSYCFYIFLPPPPRDFRSHSRAVLGLTAPGLWFRHWVSQSRRLGIFLGTGASRGGWLQIVPSWDLSPPIPASHCHYSVLNYRRVGLCRLRLPGSCICWPPGRFSGRTRQDHQSGNRD